jgi:hypothetical protein
MFSRTPGRMRKLLRNVSAIVPPPGERRVDPGVHRIPRAGRVMAGRSHRTGSVAGVRGAQSGVRPVANRELPFTVTAEGATERLFTTNVRGLVGNCAFGVAVPPCRR